MNGDGQITERYHGGVADLIAKLHKIVDSLKCRALVHKTQVPQTHVSREGLVAFLSSLRYFQLLDGFVRNWFCSDGGGSWEKVRVANE